MSARYAIGQAVRAWLKQSANLSDEQCILADRSGTRPPLPYLTVKVTTADVPIGVDEQIDLAVDDAPARHVVGERRATVSVQGFGDETAGWLERAHLALGSEPIRDLLTDRGVTVLVAGGVTDLSAFLNTSIVSRYVFEVEVYYRLTSEPDTLVEMAPDGAIVDLETQP